jgi:hypothetical protein
MSATEIDPQKLEAVMLFESRRCAPAEAQAGSTADSPSGVRTCAARSTFRTLLRTRSTFHTYSAG